MFELIGQQKLKNILDSYTIDTCPKSLMFIGEEGCGKRAFGTYLANRLGIELVDISEHYSNEELESYSLCPITKMYLVDLRLFLEKDQNKLLKFIEEPSETCFVLAVANSEIGVIDTILNRCIRLHFTQYTFDEMKQIAETFHPAFSELDYQICRTPGQLLLLDDTATPRLKAFCEELLLADSKKSYGDVLAYYTKINCYENYDQFGYLAFFNMLAFVAKEAMIKEANFQKHAGIYRLVIKYLKILTLAPKANKHDLLLSFFTDFYSEVNSVC